MTWNELKDIMTTQLTPGQMEDDVTIYNSGTDEFFQVADCHWTPPGNAKGLGAGILDDNHFFLEI